MTVAVEPMGVSDSLVSVIDTPELKQDPLIRVGDPTTRPFYSSPLFLSLPKNFSTQVEVTEDLHHYDIYERVGTLDLNRPSRISFNRYLDYRQTKTIREYYRELAMNQGFEQQKGLLPSLDLGPVGDIFGGGTIEIRPTGYATLNFSIDHQRTDNPSLPLRQQRVTTFNFDQQIQLGLQGKIGEKMDLNVNFDTGVAFDFQNELKLKHTGTEDQILQSVEAGNVSMQLGNSLIQGRQNLFGLKTQLKFGPVYVTGIASNERGRVESVSVAGGGAVETPFEKEASDYDLNRHFFLSHFFRSRYEQALENLPIINSTVRINRIEVWVEKGGTTRNNRNAIGFVDLGENDLPAPGGGQGVIFNETLINPNPSVRPADNNANDLFERLKGNPDFRKQTSAPNALTSVLGLENTLDFELAGNMRKLNTNEFTLHPQLGYISLNSPIPTDQVLFVAYNYSVNGQTFQVGEFSDDVPSDGINANVLYLKMLKSSVLRPQYEDRKFPVWDLMMKNIYSIGGFGLQRDGFFLDVKYESGTSAGKVNYFPDGQLKNKLLLQVLNIDRLTNHTAPGADNYFDFLENLTIITERGLIIFPVLEPFGSHLAAKLDNADDSAKYVFQALYDDTQQGAVQNFPHLNRFSLEGYYRSSGGNEIPLNTFQLAEGSVVVTAGGRRLVEGSDYTVDPIGGKVKIINESILSSGVPIDISYEGASAYNLQNKTMLGARAEWEASKNIRLGATILNLREQPFNLKTTLGDEPINNTIWGMDLALREESDFLTRVLDKLPLYESKETSVITGSGEFANFIPGQPKAVKNQEDRGIVFIDDFEAAKTPYGLEGQQQWKLASFPERGLLTSPLNPANTQSLGFNRAKLSWYQIDQSFYQGFGDISIPDEDLANNYTRRIRPTEIFPTASRAFGANFQQTFDLYYQPALRGPYNFQVSTDKLNQDGTFKNPSENWAGVMREVQVNNDFEAINVEFIEFWMMDPYMDTRNHRGGKLVLNLGLVNEDVLADNGLSRENGLPTSPNDLNPVDSTDWGIVSLGNPPNDFFSNDKDERDYQDVGLDGLDDERERQYFNQRFQFLDNLRGYLTPEAFQALENDPSSDNFRHFRDEDFESREAGILERYIDFNGTEGNSPAGQSNTRYTVQATNQPDTEDLNDNGSLNFAEQYWEYVVNLAPSALEPGSNYVVDSIRSRVDIGVAGQGETEVTWYQFRIPIRSGKAVNNIPNFKSINFVRMYLTDFEQEVILRMTEFQFVATQWLRYQNDLREPQQAVAPPEPPFPDFEVGSVSLEENSQKLPFNYSLPPGVERQSLNGNTQPGFLQDERSLVLRTCGLEDGDGRAIFKNTRLNLLQYKNLRMWVHAEAINDGRVPANFFDRGDAVAFIRLGLDNEFNYYEYEIPLTPSDPGLGPNIRTNTWANEFNFALSLLTRAKDDRNIAGTPIGERHEFFVPDSLQHRIFVKGTPKLSDVRTIMIGLRNPSDPFAAPICVEMWVNELRLTNFDKEGGWATNTNINIKLADLGSVNASYRQRTRGFGPLEQRITSRPQDDVEQYSVALNLNLDRFTPKDWGLQLPVNITFGERKSTPYFNPQEADVRTDFLIERQSSESARDSVLGRLRDYSRHRSIAFNNWRKVKTNPNAKSYPWDIENFDFTFFYNETYARNSLIERQFATQHRGQINYRYNFPQLSIEPFKNSKTPLKLINFSPFPTSIDIRVAGDRTFEERKMRPSSEFGGTLAPIFTKNFIVTRQYNLVWNLTKNLLVNFSANNLARVDEVRGYWNDASQRERDSVGTLLDNLLYLGRDPEKGHPNLINMGRNVAYNHDLSLTYRLPTQEFKLIDWVSGNVNYTGSFRWDQAPEINPDFGGTISNQQVIQGNGRADLRRLYSKVKPLQKILETRPQGPRTSSRPNPRQAQGNQNAAGDQEEKKEKEMDPFGKVIIGIGKEIVRTIFSVKNLDVSYSRNAGTSLPGYIPKTDNFGMDFRFTDPITGQSSEVLPPTLGFITGSQADIRRIAGENNWITRDTTLANLFMQDWTEQIDGRASIELFKTLRISVSATRRKSENASEFFRWSDLEQDYVSFDPFLAGNFTMSYIFLGTAFEQIEQNGELFSTVFQQFSDNRRVISDRLAAENPNTGLLSRPDAEGGYANGYTGTSQDVLIPALLASYGVIGADKIDLTAFPKIPLPNWSIDFNGLSNLPLFKEYFTNITIRHVYRATYSVNSFNNNLNAALDSLGNVYTTVVIDEDEQIENFYSPFNIPTVQINEQFSPLLGINVTMKNGLTGSVDYKRGRQINFSMSNLQIAEQRNQDLAVSAGLRKDKLNMKMRLFGRDINLENSVHFQFRLTMRDTREISRTLSPNGLDPNLKDTYTRGTLNWIISPSIDYVLSNRVNVKVFFEQNINNPWTSSSFPTRFSSGGFQIRFMLAN